MEATEDPRIIIKDNGELFEPDLADERLRYNVLLHATVIRSGSRSASNVNKRG